LARGVGARRSGDRSPGASMAAEMLAAYFKKTGLAPLGQSYFQPFQFDAGGEVGGGQKPNGRADAGGRGLRGEDGEWGEESDLWRATVRAGQGFRPLPFSDSGRNRRRGGLRGLRPLGAGDGAARYNSYDGLDVKDKVVLLLRYVRRAWMRRAGRSSIGMPGCATKVMLARERGAKAVLVVSGPNSPQAGELLPLTGDGALAGSGVLAASISGAAADALLAPSGKKLKDLQTGLDTENPHAEGGFMLPKVKVSLSLGLEHIKRKTAT